MDDDEFENQMSLAAIEAELKPKVVETFDKIASEYKKLRKLQEQDIANQLERARRGLAVALAGAQVRKLKDEIIVEVKSLRLNQARINSLVEQLYDINKKLVSFEGRLLRLGDSHGVAREDFLRNYRARSSIRAGSTAFRNSPPRAGRISSITKRTASRNCVARCSSSRR